MRKIRLGVLACLAAGTAVFAVATPASAATPRTSIEVCIYKFNTNGVNIRANHNTGATILGQGQSGQEFVSSPETTATGSGYTWVKGEDGSTGISGWSAEQYLTYVSCHVFTD